jgi:hypothetical protein
MGHFVLIASNYILSECESNQDCCLAPHDHISVKLHQCETECDNDREEILTVPFSAGRMVPTEASKIVLEMIRSF